MKGQTALVTGGSGGIGSGIVKRLTAEGATVIFTYRANADRANALLSELPNTGHRAEAVSVTDSSGLKKMAQTISSLDLLINCAGVTTPVPHADMDALTDEWIDRIFETNWRGAFATTRAFLPQLRASKGTVINISSVAGITGVGSNVAYCASKAALDSMTRSLARALAPDIRVLSVSPGWVLGDYSDRFDPAYIQAQIDGTPLKRLATPEKVADAIIAAHTLLTDTTGTIINVDGGRPLGT